jgi:hypothetical protein
MTKFQVNVCLEPSSAGDVNAALTAAMAPFDHNLTDDWNPAARPGWCRPAAGPARRG